MARHSRPLAERFWPKVAKQPDGCWIWQAAIRPNGYGHLAASRRGIPPLKAHRVAYELTYGPIPAGMLVCHTCDVRACCNPAHLFLGTQRDNNLDKVRKGRESRPNAKLTPAQVKAIRERLRAGESQRAIAREHGLDPSTISNIATRKHWRRVP